MARRIRHREERKNSYPGCWYYEKGGQKTYYCSFKVDGVTKEYKLGTSQLGYTLAKCNAKREELMKQVTDGKIMSPRQERLEKQAAKKTILSEVFKAYGEAAIEKEKFRVHGRKIHSDQPIYKTDRSRMRVHILPFFKDVDISSIRSGRIKSFRSHMEDKGLAAQSVKHSLGLLRRLFKHAKVQMGFSMPEVSNEVTEQLSPLQLKRYQKVLIEDGSQIADMILLIANTGCRPIDVRRLTWENVNFQTKKISLKDMKGGVSVDIEMNREAERILRRQGGQRVDRMEGYIFPFKGEMMPKYHYQKFSKRLAVKACLPEGHRPSYCLRHWYATELYSRTKDIRLVGEMLGHKDIQTTKRYAEVKNEAKVNAASIMELVAEG